jgi:hypothetical protein
MDADRAPTPARDDVRCPVADISDDPFAPLYASDLGEQVRESFEEMVGFGASAVAATQETVSRFQGALQDADDGPVVILVLAALQVKHRVVFSSIRDAAIEAIDEGAADRLSHGDSAARAQVRALLQDLREILASIDVEDEEEDEEDDDD